MDQTDTTSTAEEKNVAEKTSAPVKSDSESKNTPAVDVKKNVDAKQETSVEVSDPVPAPERKKRPPFWKRMLKRFLRFTKWFSIVVVTLLIILVLCRDAIIKASITRIGSFIMGVEITVDELKTTLDGKITITNLKVANPKGFSSPHAVSISSFYADFDVASLFSDKIIIEELDVNQLHVTAEFKNNGNCNIRQIVENIERYLDGEKNDPREIYIRKSTIRNTTATICNSTEKLSLNIKNITASTTDGYANFSELKLSAPRNFKSRHIAKLKELRIKFNPDSLYSNDTVISEIIIDNLNIACEYLNDGSSNIKAFADVITIPEEEPLKRPPSRHSGGMKIERLMVINSSLKINDSRTGASPLIPLEADFRNLSSDSGSGSSTLKFVRDNAISLHHTLSKITNTQELLSDKLKNTLKTTGKFFGDSFGKMIDFFSF